MQVWNRSLHALPRSCGTHSVALTTVAVDSYLRVQYASTPPTRLRMKWGAPFKVVSFLLSEYTLLNLITNKTRTVHASQLKPFIFNPSTQDPMERACRDYMEFFVEFILLHTGNPRKVSTLLFHVKWPNYPSSANSWEPWRNLRSCEPYTPPHARALCSV